MVQCELDPEEGIQSQVPSTVETGSTEDRLIAIVTYRKCLSCNYWLYAIGIDRR
jgi:hypothetical protein